MTQIIVQPDKEMAPPSWLAIGFTCDSDCTPEAVGALAYATLKQMLPMLERLEHWDVDYMTKPRLTKAKVQGNREAMITAQAGLQRDRQNKIPVPQVDRGLTDWVVEVKASRPKVLTPKYQDPLGPSAGFASKDDLPADLAAGLGVPTGVNN